MGREFRDQDRFVDLEELEEAVEPRRANRSPPGKKTLTSRLVESPVTELVRAIMLAKTASDLPEARRIEALLSVDLSGVPVRLGVGSLPDGAAGSTSRDGMQFRDSDPSLFVQAHEAAHAVQQGLARSTQPIEGTAASTSSVESEADRAAAAVVAGSSFRLSQRADAASTFFRMTASQAYPWLVTIYQHVLRAIPASVRRTLDAADIERVRRAVNDESGESVRGQGPEAVQPDRSVAPGNTAGRDESEHLEGPAPRPGVGTTHGYQRPLDWDGEVDNRRQRNMVNIRPNRLDGQEASGTLRENSEANRRVLVERHFGPGITMDQARASLRVAQAIGQRDVARRIQAQLFRVNQYSVVETLNNEGSERYSKRSTSGSTTCNIYVADVANALGAYVPVVWWTRQALRRMQASPPENVTPVPGETVHAVNQDQMLYWLRDWGPQFGWRHTDDPDEAQRAANSGHVVIVGTMGREVRGRRIAGHVEIIMAETDGRHDPTDSRGAPRLEAHRENGRVTDPVESSAGANPERGNFRYDTQPGRLARGERRGRGPGWWRVAEGGFFIFEGRPNSPIATPEELGWSDREVSRPSGQRSSSSE